MPFSENILHFIWKYKLFNPIGLVTTEGHPLQILNCGSLNLNSGPDFFNARIKLDDTLWAGNVEIHYKSSDWLAHRHQTDKAYDNVILHVVWEDDISIKRTNNTTIPVLTLKNIVDPNIIENYDLLVRNNYWIPCEKQVMYVDNFTKHQTLDRMLTERLESKSDLIKDIYDLYKGSWEDTFYVVLARSFGFKVNSLPFELLAKQLPQILLAKHKNKQLQVEALVFGVAGFLNEDLNDDYYQSLRNEFEFLKVKYNLIPIDKSLWKFSKTRPDNFPTIRLAQFSALILKSQHLFSKIIAITDLKDYKKLFKELPISSYWQNHYLFNRQVNYKSTDLGASSIDNVLINALAPLLFFYGRQTGNINFINYSVDLLTTIKAENNVYTRGFEERGFKISNAFDSQAVIHLKKEYCDEKKCLNCGIGLKIIKQKQ